MLFELPEHVGVGWPERKLVEGRFEGFERTESRAHLPLPMRVTDGCNGFGRRWLVRGSLGLLSVVDVAAERSDVSGSFGERSRSSLLQIGCFLPRCRQGCLGHMGCR